MQKRKHLATELRPFFALLGLDPATARKWLYANPTLNPGGWPQAYLRVINDPGASGITMDFCSSRINVRINTNGVISEIDGIY